MTYEELIAANEAAYGERGGLFQAALAELVRTERPRVVVETGVSNAVSSTFILRELHAIGEGVLHSVDPAPYDETAGRLEDERWTLWREASLTALPNVFRTTGPWDLFLHDSDHEVHCQTFEYELAWYFTRAGGIVASDDASWGTPPHRAWEHFVRRHDLTEWACGSARWIRKPIDTPVRLSEVDAVVAAVSALARRATDEYLRGRK